MGHAWRYLGYTWHTQPILACTHARASAYQRALACRFVQRRNRLAPRWRLAASGRRHNIGAPEGLVPHATAGAGGEPVTHAHASAAQPGAHRGVARLLNSLPKAYVVLAHYTESVCGGAVWRRAARGELPQQAGSAAPPCTLHLHWLWLSWRADANKNNNKTKCYTIVSTSAAAKSKSSKNKHQATTRPRDQGPSRPTKKHILSLVTRHTTFSRSAQHAAQHPTCPRLPQAPRRPSQQHEIASSWLFACSIRCIN